jgi:ketosteroid isomerase-like protein
MQELIEKTVAQYFDRIRALDAEGWVALFAEDAVTHDPVGGPPCRGRDDLRKFFNGISGLFESCDMRAEHTFISGNGAGVKWSARGVGKNGKTVTFEGIDAFVFNADGKIKEIWAYWNPGAMIKALKE